LPICSLKGSVSLWGIADIKHYSKVANDNPLRFTQKGWQLPGGKQRDDEKAKDLYSNLLRIGGVASCGRAGFAAWKRKKNKLHRDILFLILLALLGCGRDSHDRGEADKKSSAEVARRISSDVPIAAEPASDKKTSKDLASSPGSEKVSSSVRAMIAEMETRGITTQNAKELGASALSNPLVRVNEEGSIQTYIHVHTFGADEKAQLATYEVIIEIVNEKLGIIQAWIPFNRIYEVAQLPFVKRITPPSYGTLRGG